MSPNASFVREHNRNSPLAQEVPSAWCKQCRWRLCEHDAFRGQAYEEEEFRRGLRTLPVRRAPTEHTRGKKSWKTNSNAISRLIRRSSDLSQCGEIQIWTDRSVASSSNPSINNCRQAPSPEHQRSGVGHKMINSMTHWTLLPWHLYRTTPLCPCQKKKTGLTRISLCDTPASTIEKKK